MYACSYVPNMLLPALLSMSKSSSSMTTSCKIVMHL
jgi:hypothetical protein